MKFYLAGQHNFGNRGCEALVRSIFSIVQERVPGAKFFVPTLAAELDHAQWPEVTACGGEFTDAAQVPPAIKWWNRLASRLPSTIPLWEPRYTPAANIRAAFAECDAVLMTGGDNISLDYGLGSLFLWSGLMDAAQRQGRPTMLFAASVGPFNQMPSVERWMVQHLRRYSAIAVRESASLGYLRGLGIENAVQVADPAFCLEPESTTLGAPFDRISGGVLAFNVSPLIAASWHRANPGGSLIAECVAFIERVLKETDLVIALLPHVDPLDGNPDNSDSAYMQQIIDRCGDHSGRLALVRRGLNAAQTKYLVGASRYLIAARTHATVAGWSQHVPTVSIAYSIKARGLNKDLFDTLDYVLDTPKVSRDTLWAHYRQLTERESAIRRLLEERIPVWRKNARHSADLLADILD